MQHQPVLSRVDTNTGPRPFLKWPGGKRWLIRRGINLPILSAQSTYYEPFLGAASLFFALQPSNAVLSDINNDLIATYRALRANPTPIISRLHLLGNDRTTFQHVRKSAPRLQLDRAVRLIYLNRTAFAGIYRENAEGQFNVPFGNYSDRTLCQEQILLSAAAALQTATFRVDVFSHVADHARPGDIVYLDPPYILGHQNNGFIRYNRHLFTWEAQQGLAKLANTLARRGVHVIVSNAAHQDVLRLYEGFSITHLNRHNQISRNPKYRGITTEALLSSYKGAISPNE